MTRPILLMTRTRAASERFVRGLDAVVLEDVRILYSPLLDIVPHQNTGGIDPDAGVIFTSANGVAFAPDGEGRAAYCVGQRTAEKASLRGWAVKLVALDAEKLIDGILKDGVQGPLVHVAGEHRRGEIAARLSAQGVRTQVHVAYAQPLRPLIAEAKKAIFGEGTVIVPLFSPRVAAHFADQAVCGAHVQVLAMSRAVAGALENSCAARVQIVSEPTGEEMRNGVENLLRGDSLP